MTAAEAETREVWAKEHLRPVHDIGALMIQHGNELRELYTNSPPLVGSDDELRIYMAALDTVILTPLLVCVREFNRVLPA